MKNFIFILALMLTTAFCAAQSFRGLVVDENQVPLEFAIVSVSCDSDSTFITGGMTDSLGIFDILLPRSDRYIVNISYMGYKTFSVSSAPCDLGKIVMIPDEYMLGEVVVAGHRPTLKAVAGGISTEVEGSALSKAGSAEDIIPLLAGVKKKIDGSFEVIGRGTPTIYVNNRLVRDMSELKRLRSEDIRNIQLLTTPGPKYDAEIGAILKIITKNNEDNGFGFEINSGIDYAKKFNTGQQLNLDYRQGSLNVFGSFRYDLMHQWQDGSTDITTLAEKEWYQDVKSEDRGLFRSYFAKGGFNYDFTQNHSVGAMYELLSMPRRTSENHNLTDVYADNVLYDKWNTTEISHDKSVSHHVNIYYQGKISNLEIDFNADAVIGNGRGKAQVADISENFDDYECSTTDNYRNALFAGKLLLSYPIWKGGLSLGTEYTDTKRKSYSSGFGELIGQSNDKILDRNAAVFMGYNASIGLINTNIGLRYEHVTYDFYENGINQKDKSKTYDNLFPSLTLNLNVAATNLSLAYNIRTVRPAYEMLSSAVRYGNRLTYLAGTPNLQPTYINSINIGLLWKNLNVRIGYNHYKDDIFFATDQLDSDPSISINRFANVKSRNEMAASASYSPTFGIWQPSLSVTSITQWLDIELGHKTKNMNGTILYFNMGNSLQLPAGFLLRIDGNYSSDGNLQNRYMKSSWFMNVSLNKEFAGGKWNVLLEGNDLFHTMRDASWFYDRQTVQYRATKDNTRQIRLTITYRFNHKENRYKGTGAGNEEQQRL